MNSLQAMYFLLLTVATLELFGCAKRVRSDVKGGFRAPERPFSEISPDRIFRLVVQQGVMPIANFSLSADVEFGNDCLVGLRVRVRGGVNTGYTLSEQSGDSVCPDVRRPVTRSISLDSLLDLPPSVTVNSELYTFTMSPDPSGRLGFFEKNGDETLSPQVAGFNFEGAQFAVARSEDRFCPLIDSPEASACRSVQGRTILDQDCNVLCSLPIADSGRIAGFDFSGWRTAPALQENALCPLIDTREDMACRALLGRISIDEGCFSLCSFPIAQEGSVAGFDFSGWQQKLALAPDTICPLIDSQEESACRAIGGQIRLVEDCSALCSSPIAR
jgi:hypothetical protein